MLRRVEGVLLAAVALRTVVARTGVVVAELLAAEAAVDSAVDGGAGEIGRRCVNLQMLWFRWPLIFVLFS